MATPVPLSRRLGTPLKAGALIEGEDVAQFAVLDGRWRGSASKFKEKSQ